MNSTADDKRSGLVMGVVIDGVTGGPIPAAVVVLGGGVAVVADGAGRFAFTDLTGGRYQIRASKLGYFEGAYGRLRPAGAERAVDLAPDERVGDIEIKLWKHSSVGGVITDEHGEPMAGIRVAVFSRVQRAGTRVLIRSGETRTDDRGMYRVEELTSGEHLIVALPYGLPPTQAGVFAYPAQYAPGVPNVAEATPVTLRVGEDRAGVDLQLRLTAAFSVSGITYDQTGNPVAATLTLTSATNDASLTPEIEAASVSSGSDGRFSFSAVTRGSYTLRAVAEPPAVQTNPNLPSRLTWTSVPVGVDASDVRGIDVTLRPGVHVSGRVEFESLSGKRFGADARRLTGVIEPVAGQMLARARSATFAISTSGSFITPDLLPGRYVFRIEGLPDAWSVKRIVQGGRDVTNAPIDVDRDVTYLAVTMTDGASELSGAVRRSERPEPAATVIMFPANSDAWPDAAATGIGVRSTRAGRDGNYRFASVPPGDYYVLAVEDDVTNGWKDEHTFADLARVATRVSLAGGEKRPLDLKIAVLAR